MTGVVIQRLRDGRLYVLADGARARPSHALGGPFATREAAGTWIVTHVEATLPPDRRALWGELFERAGGLAADLWQLVGLIGWVAAGRPRAALLRYAVPMPDPVSLACPVCGAVPERRAEAVAGGWAACTRFGVTHDRARHSVDRPLDAGAVTLAPVREPGDDEAPVSVLQLMLEPGDAP